MNPNLAHRFKVFVDDEEVNYVQSVTYNSRGNNQLDSLDVRISGSLSASKNYFGKPMTFFLDSNDGVPIFRGFIKDVNTTDTSISLKGVDVRGYLTSDNINTFTLNDDFNFDGFSLGGFLKSYIDTNINIDKTLIGIDNINDTDPIISLSGVRGDFKPYDLVKQMLNDRIDDTKASEQPLRYQMTTVDDGVYSHIKFVQEKLKSSYPSITLSEEEGIISYSYKKRPKKFKAHYQNRTFSYGSSLSSSFGTKYDIDKEIPPADAEEMARKMLLADLNENIEITLNCNRGFDLNINDLVNIDLKNQDIDGIHKVVGKNISVGSSFKFKLKLSKQRQSVSKYLNQ